MAGKKRKAARTRSEKRSRAVSLTTAAPGGDAGSLRLDRVSFVMVHNAYEREAAPPDALHFDDYVAHLYSRLGVRGIELDFAEDLRHWAWSVSHDDRYAEAMPRQLGVYLRALWAWSIKHEPHDPMVVTLEPKSVFRTDWAPEFDAYLEANFDPSRIFRPADLRGSSSSLEQAARARGWPTIEALQNRFVFIVSGDGEAARAVAARPNGHCFGDRALSDTPGRIADNDDPSRLILNFPSPEARELFPGPVPGPVSETRWIEIMDEVATMPWLLPRIYYCDQPRHVDLALQHGAWMLATNQPDTVMSRLDHQPYRPRVLPVVRARTRSVRGAVVGSTRPAAGVRGTRRKKPRRARTIR